MSYMLIIFPTPDNAYCELRHDADGIPVVAVPTAHPTGRPGQGFVLPDYLPNGNGATLTISAPHHTTLIQRGIVWLNDGILYPWTPEQTAAFAADDFHLPAQSAGLPRLVLNGQFLAQETTV